MVGSLGGSGRSGHSRPIVHAFSLIFLVGLFLGACVFGTCSFICFPSPRVRSSNREGRTAAIGPEQPLTAPSMSTRLTAVRSRTPRLRCLLHQDLFQCDNGLQSYPKALPLQLALYANARPHRELGRVTVSATCSRASRWPPSPTGRRPWWGLFYGLRLSLEADCTSLSLPAI